MYQEHMLYDNVELESSLDSYRRKIHLVKPVNVS